MLVWGLLGEAAEQQGCCTLSPSPPVQLLREGEVIQDLPGLVLVGVGGDYHPPDDREHSVLRTGHSASALVLPDLHWGAGNVHLVA